MQTKSLLLDHYHCTFFLPLIDLPQGLKPQERLYYTYKADAPTGFQEQGETKQNQERDAQAHDYFSPVVRNILFNPGGQKNAAMQPVEEWRLDTATVNALELHLGKEKDRQDPLKYQQAVFVAVTLYRYFNGIYLLAFRVVPKALRELWQEQKRPKQVAGNGLSLFTDRPPYTAEQALQRGDVFARQYTQLQLEAWLHFTRLARLLYPSFAGQESENKISGLRLFGKDTSRPLATAFDNPPEMPIQGKSSVALSPVVSYLLACFFNETDKAPLKRALHDKVPFYDDRMFVSVAYGLAQQSLTAEQRQRLFALALFVDRHVDAWDEMDGYVYSAPVVKERLQEQSMPLWEGLGGYFGYSDYANAALYSGKLFREVIAPVHIPYIYDRMLIQTLFYQASLRKYDKEICTKTQEILAKNSPGSVRGQRREFIRFTNQYWFEQLTEQMQGKWIFRLQQQGLMLTQYHQVIKDELERTDEYLQSVLADKLNRWGFWIAVIALYIGYISVLPVFNDFTKEVCGVTLWKWVGDKCSAVLGTPDDSDSLVGLFVLLAPIILLLLWVVVRGIVHIGGKCWSHMKRVLSLIGKVLHR